MKRIATISAMLWATTVMSAAADVNVCVTVSATGPAAALGIPQRNSVALLPAELAGQNVKFTIFDDATDPTAATRNARKCVEDEQADVIIGSSTVPTSSSAASIAAETGTPIIALAPTVVTDEVRKWTFQAMQSNGLMAGALVDHMKASGVKTLGFIGYSDSFGDDWIRHLEALLPEAGIEFAPVERFARTDNSVTGQALKLVAAKPDAVLVVASGSPAALPPSTLRERGYQGQIYETHGAASPDFIRIGGNAVEGVILPVGPVIVADELPESHPAKSLGLAYGEAYLEQHPDGPVSAFGAALADASALIEAALPSALEAGQPGTPEFRAALRDGIESAENVVGPNGVYTMSPEDHSGHDTNSRVLVQVTDGQFRYLPLN